MSISVNNPGQAIPISITELQSKIVSKPNAILEVRVIQLPSLVKQGIAANLRAAREAAASKRKST